MKGAASGQRYGCSPCAKARSRADKMAVAAKYDLAATAVMASLLFSIPENVEYCKRFLYNMWGTMKFFALLSFVLITVINFSFRQND